MTPEAWVAVAIFVLSGVIGLITGLMKRYITSLVNGVTTSLNEIKAEVKDVADEFKGELKEANRRINAVDERHTREANYIKKAFRSTETCKELMKLHPDHE